MHTGSQCLDKRVFESDIYDGTNFADISQPCPSEHNNTKHLSSSVQLKYHSIACILIDRHRKEPLANLAPHREQLFNFIPLGKMAFHMAERNSSSMMEWNAMPFPSTAQTETSQVQEQYQCTSIFCTHTLTLRLTAAATCTKLETTFSWYRSHKNHGFKKKPKNAETWGCRVRTSTCEGKGPQKGQV